MNDQKQVVQLQPKQASVFSLVPQSLRDAMELAKIMADSDMVPKDYKGKPGNVLIAVQMGAEVGLAPMAAIQSIAVINGKPGLYGDVGKAILLSKGFIIEEDDVETIKKTGMGRCKITRPGHPPCERTFSLDSARSAGLIGNAGPWTQYKERQMAWRAFWFAARDIAADLLKGLSGAEEVIDIEPRDITSASVRIQPELETYPDDKFNENFPIWSSLISDGRKTADDVIATVSSKASLTDDQKEAIRAVKVADKAASPEQMKAIYLAAEEAAIATSDMTNHLGLESLDGITSRQADDILAFIANPAGE